jgi:hypothetical protein
MWKIYRIFIYCQTFAFIPFESFQQNHIIKIFIEIKAQTKKSLKLTERMEE